MKRLSLIFTRNIRAEPGPGRFVNQGFKYIITDNRYRVAFLFIQETSKNNIKYRMMALLNQPGSTEFTVELHEKELKHGIFEDNNFNKESV